MLFLSQKDRKIGYESHRIEKNTVEIGSKNPSKKAIKDDPM